MTYRNSKTPMGVKAPGLSPVLSPMPRRSRLAFAIFAVFSAFDALNAGAAVHARRCLLLLAGCMGGIGCMGTAQAYGLPDGPMLRHGDVSIFQEATASSLSIHQRTRTAAIDWSSFDIGEHGYVFVNQPSAHAILVNRVVGDAPSVVAGHLVATGTVVLINPNGIGITPSGSVNASGFLASTLALDDAAIKTILLPERVADRSADIGEDIRRWVNTSLHAAPRTSSRPEPRDAPRIAHSGTIRVASGGTAMLMGERVTVGPRGKIISQGGRIVIVAAEPVQAAPSMAISAATATATTGHTTGPTIAAPMLSDNVPLLAAAHLPGRAVLPRAPAVQLHGMFHTACHLGQRGQVLVAAEGKSVDIAGEMDATSVGAQGGTIDVRAADITVHDALLSTQGSHGGGRITMSTGATPPHEAHVHLSDATLLLADAIEWGKGGDISVSTLGDLHFDATAHAKGARDGSIVPLVPSQANGVGDGGAILLYAGTELAVRGDIDASRQEGAALGRVEFRARSPRVGDWRAERNAARTASSGQHNVDEAHEANEANEAVSERPANVIDATTLSRSLQTANLVLSSERLEPADDLANAPADIEVQAPFEWSSTSALMLHSASNIRIHALVRAVNRHASVHFTMANGAGWEFNGGAMQLPGTSAVMTINGTLYGLLHGPRQMITALSRGDNGHYALAMPIDMAAIDVQPIVTPSGNYFSHFEGLGNTIANLRIHAPSVRNVGLFGTLGDTARVSNLVIENADVLGGQQVGILSGMMKGRSAASALTLMNARATLAPALSAGARADRVSHGSAVGGMAGIMSDASLAHCIGGTVNVHGDQNVGGITGTMSSSAGMGWISLAGAVRGTGNVGGLVGRMSGPGAVLYGTWHGAVNAISTLPIGPGAYGGLVGYQTGGTIDQSHASGTVDGNGSAGGLVGWAAGDAVLANCSVANRVSGWHPVGSVAGVAQAPAMLSAIQVARADPRLAHIGSLVQYSGRPVLHHVIRPDVGNEVAGSAGARSIVVRPAAGEMQYLPEVLPPSVSPGGLLDASHIPHAPVEQAATLSSPLRSANVSPLMWQAEPFAASASDWLSGGQALPIFASPPLSPHGEEALSERIVQARDGWWLPADYAMAEAGPMTSQAVEQPDRQGEMLDLPDGNP